MLGNVVVMHDLRSHCHNRTLIVLLCILGNSHTMCESNKEPAYCLRSNFAKINYLCCMLAMDGMFHCLATPFPD